MAKKKNKLKKGSSLELALKAIEQAYGKGTILTQGQAVPGVEFSSSGCYSVDKALGGGWPRGRIVEVYGPESSGKTTLCLHAIAQVQKDGGKAAFIDVEHALDPEYATNLGVNMQELLVSQPDSAEQALNIVQMLTETGELDIIVIDSVAALVPLAEAEGDIGASHVGLQSRLMGQAMRKLAGIVNETNTILIFINQIRMKIGILFGSPETTSGGQALKFYASQRVDIRRTGGHKQGDQFVGNETRVKVVKNKVAAPFKIAEILIEYGKGIDTERDILRAAVEAGVVDKAGAWYSYKGEQLGQGEDNSIETIEERNLYSELREKLLSKETSESSTLEATND